jgi:hypothetical protein
MTILRHISTISGKAIWLTFIIIIIIIVIFMYIISVINIVFITDNLAKYFFINGNE